MNITDLQKKLDGYETDINNAEKKKSNIEGKQEALLEKLKSEFKINDIDGIDNYIKENQDQVDNLEKEIQNNLSELEKYDWE